MNNRKSIANALKLRLFSASAGYCQRPHCLQPLYPEEMGGDKHIAEMAHIIPYGQAGPRHEDKTQQNIEIDSFENLILLCPTCHKIIDKDPAAHPRDLLLAWKNNHLTELMCKQGIIQYSTRLQTREAILTIMAENKAIWQKFAPCDGELFECDPESENAQIWKKRVRNIILPNHFRIQAIIELNQHHMTILERETFAQYQEHIRGISERHIGNVANNAIRYPIEMDRIFS